MLKRKTTFKTSSARTTSTAPSPKLTRLVVLALALTLARPAGAEAPDVPVETILAAYDRATHAEDVQTIETQGTIVGEGLTGAFHSWRTNESERDDEQLGPRIDTTLRLGDRLYLRDQSGNVRELKGYLKRRALTSDFVDSGAFIKAPERSKFLGMGSIGRSRAWRLEVRANGGEPETLWIDTTSGLPLRTEYLDGDGPTTIDFSDWREIEGRRYPFHSVTSDGDTAFDVVEQTTSILIDRPIAADVFAPLHNRTLDASGVQTLPLREVGQHFAVQVAIGGTPATFLLDTGAQSVLVDAAVAKKANLPQQGALEVRGATRTGGLHVITIPKLSIGTASLDDLVGTSIDLGNSTAGSVRVDGILGYPFFASSLVEIDFAHNTMRFGAPGSFVPRGEKIALDLDRGIVEAVLRLDNRVDASFIIDTGNSAEMLLYRNFVDAHPGVVPFSDKASFMYGIGGTTPTRLTTLDELRLGTIPLYHVATTLVLAEKGAFADRVDAGNIGVGVLRNFIVTFDLSNGAMYLERGDAFNDGHTRTATTS